MKILNKEEIKDFLGENLFKRLAKESFIEEDIYRLLISIKIDDISYKQQIIPNLMNIVDVTKLILPEYIHISNEEYTKLILNNGSIDDEENMSIEYDIAHFVEKGYDYSIDDVAVNIEEMEDNIKKWCNKHNKKITITLTESGMFNLKLKRTEIDIDDESIFKVENYNDDIDYFDYNSRFVDSYMLTDGVDAIYGNYYENNKNKPINDTPINSDDRMISFKEYGTDKVNSFLEMLVGFCAINCIIVDMGDSVYKLHKDKNVDGFLEKMISNTKTIVSCIYKMLVVLDEDSSLSCNNPMNTLKMYFHTMYDKVHKQIKNTGYFKDQKDLLEIAFDYNGDELPPRVLFTLYYLDEYSDIGIFKSITIDSLNLYKFSNVSTDDITITINKDDLLTSFHMEGMKLFILQNKQDKGRLFFTEYAQMISRKLMMLNIMNETPLAINPVMDKDSKKRAEANPSGDNVVSRNGMTIIERKIKDEDTMDENIIIN